MSRPIGAWLAPPRFLAFAAAFAIGLALAVPAFGWARGAMVAFDAAAALFLLLAAPLLRRHDPAEIRRQASVNDANRPVLLLVAAATLAVILAAVATELAGKPDGATRPLIIATLALAWLFSNSLYALHYAHLHYREGSAGGLQFSGEGEPDYADFVYFAFTLGMTFQTSDTAVTTPAMRRAVTGHCLVAFVFNIGVLAFSINVLGAG